MNALLDARRGRLWLGVEGVAERFKRVIPINRHRVVGIVVGPDSNRIGHLIAPEERCS